MEKILRRFEDRRDLHHLNVGDLTISAVDKSKLQPWANKIEAYKQNFGIWPSIQKASLDMNPYTP